MAKYSLKEALFIASKHTTVTDRNALRMIKDVFDGEVVAPPCDTGEWHKGKTFIVEDSKESGCERNIIQ
jgi:hypothetical protein